MADNRLLIGNKETLDFVWIGKNYGNPWTVDIKLLEAFIKSYDNVCFDKINIELFTDSDDCYKDYICSGTNVRDELLENMNVKKSWLKSIYNKIKLWKQFYSF